MGKVKERFWIQQLRRIVKPVHAKCKYCKKAMTKPFNNPATSRLPSFRTNFTRPFSTTGVNFPGTSRELPGVDAFLNGLLESRNMRYPKQLGKPY